MAYVAPSPCWLNQLEEFCCPNQPLNLSGYSNERCYSQILSVGAEVGEVKAGKKVLFSDINAYEVSRIDSVENIIQL
ncbi:hypothetical protein Pyn_22026 [Prunus yedoensis var. nudiflora]|uniref:Uncharacterized protein n=1 Tax=Prunus yedoensis var. nudiflora TaxID=2094558 RepID=A0A314UQL3_PRUYE|nr:hypothetical protein Pyn_22026 [Prunus yedoensis var. nudiflora]